MNPEPPILTGHVAGSWLPPGDRVVVRENPGRSDEVAARWCPASPEMARTAMDAAAGVFGAWAQRPLAERAAALSALAGRIEQDADRFAELIVRENGKTYAEARAEIAAGLRDARYLLAQARHDGTAAVVSAPYARVQSTVIPEPVGVFLLITPWNFPLATILRKLFPALAYGNSAVVKPSELTPGPAHRLFELAAHESLPRGIASLVPGVGTEIAPALLGHPALRGVSFTGSTRVGREIMRAVADRDVRLQLEMGGKNTLVVLADADLEAAVEAAVVGGFSCAGQWCTGTGRVVVAREISSRFCDRLVERVQALRVGPGDTADAHIGPLATAARVDATRAAVNEATSTGARVLCGGTPAQLPPEVRGHFFAPTVLDRVDESSRVFIEELFAPVLPIAEACDEQHAVRLANSGGYGLSASVFSRDVDRALALAAKIESGMVHVNLHTAYREPALPVGGWRDSGRGIPECGRFAREFFTRPRACYVQRP